MKISIRHQEDMRFIAESGKHQIVCDLPIPHGGTDQGMPPPELFVASIGSCIGVYVVDCCENLDINYAQLEIDLEWIMAMEPKRIKRINIKLALPDSVLSREQEIEILKAVDSCMLHNTLIIQPEINVNLAHNVITDASIV